METQKYYSEIKKRFGPVRRARGCFLYTQKNIRVTDLFLEGGRAILGWDSKAFTVFKNQVSKALCGTFESASRAQLQKAVSALLSSKRRLYYFTEKKSAMEAALFFAKEGSVSVYKAFSGADYSKVKSVVVLPPLPWTNNFFILAVLIEENDFEKGEEPSLLEPDLLGTTFPSALEAAAARAVYDLIQAQKVRKEKDFFLYDTALKKYFLREGCYLRPKVSKDEYDDFVLFCLDAHVAISPNYNIDSIVPFGADAGVFNLLKQGDFKFAKGE